MSTLVQGNLIISGSGANSTLMFLAAKEQSAPEHPVIKEKGFNVDATGLDEAQKYAIYRPGCRQVYFKDA